MAVEAGGDGRAGIGTRLRAAREKKGLTILQAAEKMHVDPRILESLEAEDFAALGAAVYARGHLRHYAELVGEQPAQLQELYANSSRAALVQPDLTRIAHVPLDSDSGKLAGSAVVALVAIAAIGTLWWFLTSSPEKLQPTLMQGSGQTDSAGRPASLSATTTPREAESGASAGTSAKQSAEVLAGAQQGVRATPVTRTADASVASGAPRSTTFASAPTASPAAAIATATKSVGSSAGASATGGKEGELTLKFSSDSWAEVYDASGQRLFYDVGAASTAHTVRGSVPMRVVLGNAAGVALEFNGRPAPIPPGIASDGSVRFVINAHGRAVPATDGG